MVNPINSIDDMSTLLTQKNSVSDNSFADILKDAVKKVNELQNKALDSDLRLSMGDAGQLHDVMIDSVKADLALELTIAIRNKALEAYQEIMRMQV
ncbi:flagellar hook-basal body complex protein FliE [Calorimonas adulescens]|jgi:flagellar hook-basal body complex protein FliE|uniref:Flagellar hook-basal body complex protein FliE n=1 Tax=Calorimonas adulescens TaxID=2606906 RepID=A0A5D8QJA3_9THEO|nr:flagellar hook-basal body complex protein FliE [Calorimonas adulescens]TZE83358.1 flagellar hook-basal body complex protein FliE [Calorimonas adulescens]